jgi:hypothetical protein
LAEYVLPRPAWAGPAPKLNAKALWKELRARAATYTGVPKDPKLAEAARIRLQSEEVPPPAAPELELAVATLCGPGAIDKLIDHWVSTGGPGHALRAYTLAYERDPMTPDDYTAWRRLALHLAPVPAAERLALAQEVSGTSLGSGLFPESGDADRAAQGGSRDARVLGGITELASLHSIMPISYYFMIKMGSSWSDYSLLPLLTTWTATLGEAVVPLLEDLLKQAATDAHVQREVAQTLGLIASARAFELLAARADERSFVGPLREAALREPLLALPVLATRAAQRGAAAMPCRAILGQVLEADDAALEAVIEGLAPAPKKLVMELRAKANAVIEEASAAELPSWLVTPPWEVRLTKATATALSLKVLPYEPTIVWPRGLRENWAARIRRRTAPINYPKQWGISDDLAKRLSERDEPADEAEAKLLIAALPSTFSPWEENLVGLPPRLTRKFMRLYAHRSWFGTDLFCKELATDELDALDVVLPFAKHHPNIGLAILLPVGLPELAEEAAAQLLKAKREPAYSAIDWLKLHPEAAAIGLIPNALGKPGKARDGAEKALRFLAQEGHEKVVLAVATRYGDAALQGVKEAMAANPAAQTPTKIPTLPDFVRPTLLPRLALAASGNALPEVAMRVALTMLQLSTLEVPYASLSSLKEVTTPASRAALAWELFQAWLVAGAPSKEGWCFTALGHFGDDTCARSITPLIRAWPGEAQHQRAVTGLDVLAMIGTDVALMNLHGIAQKLKFKGLQEKARGKIDDIAKTRGFTADELADRLVPDLGLDEDGSLTLDFGARQFHVAFDESLKPVVKEGGKVLADLPKPK